MIADLWSWVQSHPWSTVTISVTVIITVLNKVLEYYGPGSSGLARALRFVIDLLSMLPMRGSPSRGLMLPLLSLSAPPPVYTRARRLATLESGCTGLGALIGLLVLLALIAAGASGCTGWRDTAAKAIDGVSRFGDAARARADGDQACRPIVEQCKREKVYPCDKLDKCQVAQLRIHQANMLLQSAALETWEAIRFGKQPSAEAAIVRAMEAALTIQKALGALGVRLP